MKMNHVFFDKAFSLYTGMAFTFALISKVFNANTEAKVALIFALINLFAKLILQLARYHFLLHYNKK